MDWKQVDEWEATTEIWGRGDTTLHPSTWWRRKDGFTFLGSCLENPRDRGAWWAAIYGVAQSRTRLTSLSSCGKPIRPRAGP